MKAKKIISDGSPAMDAVIALHRQGLPCARCTLPIDGECEACDRCGRVMCAACAGCRCEDYSKEIEELEKDLAHVEDELSSLQWQFDDAMYERERLEKELRDLKKKAEEF